MFLKKMLKHGKNIHHQNNSSLKKKHHLVKLFSYANKKNATPKEE